MQLVYIPCCPGARPSGTDIGLAESERSLMLPKVISICGAPLSRLPSPNIVSSKDVLVDRSSPLLLKG